MHERLSLQANDGWYLWFHLCTYSASVNVTNAHVDNDSYQRTSVHAKLDFVRALLNLRFVCRGCFDGTLVSGGGYQLYRLSVVF